MFQKFKSYIRINNIQKTQLTKQTFVLIHVNISSTNLSYTKLYYQVNSEQTAQINYTDKLQRLSGDTLRRAHECASQLHQYIRIQITNFYYLFSSKKS